MYRFSKHINDDLYHCGEKRLISISNGQHIPAFLKAGFPDQSVKYALVMEIWG